MASPDYIVASDGGSSGAGEDDCFSSWAFVTADKQALSKIRAEITNIIGMTGSLVGAARTRMINKNLNVTIPLEHSCGIIPGGTSNAGEIMGAYKGLSNVRGKGSVIWYTDSKYTLDSITRWCRKNSRTDPTYLNGKAIFELADLYDEMIPYGLKGLHVNSHKKMPETLHEAVVWYLNKRADMLCTEIMIKYKNDIIAGVVVLEKKVVPEKTEVDDVNAIGKTPIEPKIESAASPLTIEHSAVPSTGPSTVPSTEPITDKIKKEPVYPAVWPTELKLLIPLYAINIRPTNKELETAVELFNLINPVEVRLDNVIIIDSALWELIENQEVKLDCIFGADVSRPQLTSVEWWKKVNLSMLNKWIAKLVMFSICL